MTDVVIALEVLFSAYLLMFAWLCVSEPKPRKPDYWSDDLLEDDMDRELARILDGRR